MQQLANEVRDEIVIASKFGIPANPLLEQFPILQWPVKGVKSALRYISTPQVESYASARFSAIEADKNLARSLKALRTEYLDILFLHEPQLQDCTAILALAEWAKRRRALGDVRHFGLAGQHSIAVASALGESQWCELIQAPINWNATRYGEQNATPIQPQILYGVFATSTNADSSRSQPANRISNSHHERLQNALLNAPHSTILFSTTKADHVRVAIEALADASNSQRSN